MEKKQSGATTVKVVAGPYLQERENHEIDGAIYGQEFQIADLYSDRRRPPGLLKAHERETGNRFPINCRHRYGMPLPGRNRFSICSVGLSSELGKRDHECPRRSLVACRILRFYTREKGKDFQVLGKVGSSRLTNWCRLGYQGPMCSDSSLLVSFGYGVDSTGS